MEYKVPKLKSRDLLSQRTFVFNTVKTIIEKYTYSAGIVHFHLLLVNVVLISY